MRNELDPKQVTWIKNEEEVAKPSLYQVLIHNDDFTPFEFVMAILENFFFMDRRKAAEITMEAHAKGIALCGIFSKDFAEAKVQQVIAHARKHEHPLLCSSDKL